MSEFKRYSYVKLTPKVFQKLMIENLNNKRFSRKQAIDLIEEKFRLLGGDLNGVDGISVFKKASNYLKNSGLRNVGYGIWELEYVNTQDESNKIYDDIEEVSKSESKSTYFYVYYLDAYKSLAKLNNETYWKCCFGYVKANSESDVKILVGQNYPELPKFIICTQVERASLIKSALKQILQIRRNLSDDSDWIMTNDREVFEIFNELIKN